MRVSSLTPFLVFVVLSIAGNGCNEDNSNIAGSPSDIVFPPQNISFAQHVQPLFNQTCALSQCHDDGPHQSDLCLTSYYNTMFRTPGVVIATHPELSTLVFRIEGSSGERMPLNTPPLNQNQINGIRTWIVEGAQDN
jgi:hypothetical protein